LSLERQPSRDYDLFSEIQRVDSDLSDFIEFYGIDTRWLRKVDHIGIETAGFEDFEEIFDLLSHDAVNAYKGLVFHRHLAAIELSEGLKVHPNAESAKWIELIGPREKEILTNSQYTGMPWYPDANNIHFGYFHKNDQAAYEYFKNKNIERVSNLTPVRRSFNININSTGDSIQIVDKPLNEIIEEYTNRTYTDVDLKKI